MGDAYWKGGTSTDPTVAGNWVDSGGSAFGSVPDTDDNIKFDSKADKNCVFTSTATYLSIEIISTFDKVLYINSTTVTVTANPGLQAAATRKIASTGSGIIKFTGTGDADKAWFDYHSTTDIYNSDGMFQSKISRKNITFQIEPSGGCNVCFHDGVWPNISIVAGGNAVTMSPVAITNRFPNNGYSIVDMWNLTVDAGCEVLPHVDATVADIDKVFRIRGQLTISSNQFFMGNAELRLTPWSAGSVFPVYGAVSNYGTGDGSSTAKVFKSKFHNIVIEPNEDTLTHYFTLLKGTILSCNNLEIKTDAKIYGPYGSGTIEGAEIHSVNRPTVHGDWNFTQVGDGIYRSIDTLPSIGTQFGGTGLSAIGKQGQVLAVKTGGTELEWSSTAGGTSYTHPNHSGDVTSSGDGATTIANDAVTYAKMQDVSATSRVLGRITSGSGVVEELTGANIRTIANVEDGATADQSNAEIRAAVEAASDSNVFTDTDHSKLNAIEASATADQTAVEIIGLLNSDLNGNFTIGNQEDDSATFSGPLSAVGTFTLNHAGSDGYSDIIGPNNRDLRFILRDNGVGDSFLFRNAAGDDLLDVNMTGNVTTKGVIAGLDGKLQLGASQQLDIDFAGSHTRITHDAATDSWMIFKNEDGAGFQFNIGSDKGIEINKNDNVELYYDNSKKFETTSAGGTLTGALTVTGDLIVNGDTTTVDTATLSVEDPLIILASGNTSADSVDIGFYGLYDTSGSQDLYAGLFRDANDSGKFKLFKDLQAAPTTTVDTSGTGYAVGTLVANLDSGTVTSAGSVAIGNAGSAGYKLDVQSGTTDTIARFKSSDANGRILIQDNDDTIYVGTTSGYAYIGGTQNLGGGANLVVHKTSGNVGIGSTTPATKLHIERSEADSENLMLRLRDSTVDTVGNRIGIEGFWNTVPAGDIEFELTNTSSGAAAIVFSPHSGSSTKNEAMRIASDGNVGIGDTSPAEKLQVAGNILVNNDASILADGSGRLDLGNTSGGTFRIFGDGSSSIIQSNANHFYIQTNRDSDDIIFRVNDGGTDSDTTVVEAMRIHAPDGNVGIGTTAPAGLLDIMGTSGNQLRLSYNANYYWILERDSSGKLNITNHQNSTDVKALTITTDEQVLIGKTATTTTVARKFETEGTMAAASADGTGTGFNMKNSEGEFLLYTDGGDMLVKDYAGSSTYPFKIVGAAETDTLKILTGGDVYVKDRLGVGTDTPGTKLEVAGDITAERLNLDKASGYASIEIGGPSGAFIDMKNPFSDDYDCRLITDGTGLDIIAAGSGNHITLKTNGVSRMQVNDSTTVLYTPTLHFSTGSAPAIRGGNHNPITIWGNEDGTPTSTSSNVVTRSTAAALDFDVNSSQQLAMRIKDNRDIDVYGVLSGPGIAEGGYGANSFHFGDTGGTEDDDWYEVFRWTPNVAMSATTSNQYRNFAAKFNVLGRGVQRINYDIYVRGEYGVQGSTGWWAREFIIDGLEQSTDADGNVSPDADSIFKMVSNSGDSLSMPYASLYYRRDEDWEIRTCNLISMFTNCVFEFKDTNVGETTPTNDTHTGSYDLSPSIRKKLRVDVNNQLINGVSATGIYFDETNDRLGIGTASPDEPLHVFGTDSGPIAKFERDGQESVYISGNNGWGNLYTSDGVLAFGTGGNAGANAQMILSGGNLGIGTDGTVDAKLHVEGSVLIDAYNVGEDAGLFFREGFLTTDQPSITVWDMSNSGASPDGLSINANDGIRFRENGGEVARFKDGSLGIGTTSPSSKLDVVGTIECTGLNLQNGSLDYGGGVQQSGDLAVGWYTFAVCKGRDATTSAQRAFGEFLINDVDSGRHGSCRLNASHMFGAGNSIQVFAYNFYSTAVFTQLRIKESGTYAGAALQVYVSNANNNLESYMTLSEQNQSWDLLDTWLADSDDSGHDAILGYATHSQDWSGFAASQTVDLSIFDVSQGGIYTTGGMYAEELELKDSTGITIQTANSNARHKKIFATTSNDGSPWDEMVYYSRGSAGGWSGQHTFTVDKSGTSGTGYEALRIRDSGNGTSSEVLVSHALGVGTTDPTFASGSGIHIKDGTQANLRLEENAGEFFDVAMQNGDVYLINRVSDGFMSFRTNSTERMRILSGGNVGIGTDSPDTLFEIKEGGTGAAVMRLRNSNTSYPDDTAFGRIEFYNADSSGAGITAQIEAVSDASGRGGQFAFKTDASGTSPSTRMFIQGDGKVGINTVSPGYKLDVNGDIRAQDDMYCDKLIASEAIRSSSRASFNTMTYYYYDRQSMGTDAVYLRSVVGGSSSANPSSYFMPHAGQVMQVMMGFYGQTLATSGTDTWTIHKINTGGVTSSVTFDINFANLNRIATSNNYNILIDVTVLSDASNLDFAVGDILQIQRTDGRPIDVEHVKAQLWVTFDA